jgi:formate dehydrogenase beta subunit
MLTGVFIMGLLGAVCGAGLAIASKVFYVYVDPKIEAVGEALPGANCGGCGLPGCSANAVAIVEGKASPSSCVAGGEELAAEIATIMGVKVEAKEPDIARPGCTYGVEEADLKYIYAGINDCRASVLLNGGSKVCPVGCLGLGTCVKACPFGALSMGPDNLPVVDKDLCTGCGTCERVCPRHIITLTSNSRRIQGEYTTDDCTAPCQRSCPAGIAIPNYIREISEGNFLEAVRIIKESNPFPSVCGRICVHPCEYECRRNLVDEPVAINYLKRFAADYEMNSGQRTHVPRAPENGKRVAVVGGGAEGLTAAYFLNRLGYDANVYEATSQLGGLLRAGLPENRLPRDILDWEVGGILDAGVNAITNQKLGRDYTIESLLKEGHSAVFVATGGWDTQLSGRAESENSQPLPGVNLLLDLVLNQRAGTKPSAGKDIMILGGGNASLEAAKSSVKEGAKSVSVVFRTPRENAALAEKDLKKAEEEGIKFYFQTAVTRMFGKAGELTQVEIVQLSPQGEEQGERETLPIDMLVTGAGRFPELIYIPRTQDQEGEQGEVVLKEPVEWETVSPYPGPFAEQDIGMFRPGEVTSDYKAVVEAIGSGRRAASSVHRSLVGEPVEAPDNMIRKYTQVLSLDQLEPVSQAPRQKMPELPAEERINDPSAEIALGYSQDEALQEASRCLQCGLICYRRMEGRLH